jgi:hypothetical protein
VFTRLSRCSTLTGTLLRDQGPENTQRTRPWRTSTPRKYFRNDTARPRDVVFETRRIPTDCGTALAAVWLGVLAH